MKSIIVFGLLAAAVQAQSSAQGHYDSICPGKNEKTEPIVDGYTVQYTCDYVGEYGGKAETSSSPQDCAERCKAKAGCTGSTWKTPGNCVLSGNKKALSGQTGAIYMKRVEETKDDPNDDPFGPSCDEQLEDCEKEKQELIMGKEASEGEISNCKEHLDECNAANESLQEQLASGSGNGNSGSFPIGGNKKVEDIDLSTGNWPFLKKVAGTDLPECAEKCRLDSDCQRVGYSHYEKQCVFDTRDVRGAGNPYASKTAVVLAKVSWA
ncbi:hypothetical protein N7493_007284 [Penicillium malachiteum]|uniref:Apple domain-containing protein n=1 Tax=Penicillium malachiteum TaxID=1324776 RepID=A0AAD6HIZ2_9EURO|nr:hypothetical protein N7493_007284 [Penicillium malachiteum]